MYLSGPQIKAFVEALTKSYTPNRFNQLLLGRLDKMIHNITMAPDYITQIYDVVMLANNEGWVFPLLDAARASNPNNAYLLAFEETLNRGSVPSAAKMQLEKIVNERSAFQNVMAFRERLGLIEAWICAFEIPNSGGTGVLVGPDIVLTNYHVIESLLAGQVSPANARCRFDYKALSDGTAVNAGTSVNLADPWDVVHAPYSIADTKANGGQWDADELDFALVRLADEVGNQPIGENPEPQAPSRGWLHLSGAPAVLAAEDVVLVLQHPQDLTAASVKLQPMQLAVGTVMGFVGNGLRVRHNTRTLPGSSGSPVFNANLEIAALHHAGEPNNRLDYTGEYNQGIPIGEIVRFLKDHGHADVLPA